MTVLASDGLPARESGEWAADKLFYVSRYIDIFTGGMKNKWPRRAYVDLMSGPGRCIVVATGIEFDGSPVLALKAKTPFTDVILVEEDPALVEALKKRTSQSDLRPAPEILLGDCNDKGLIDEVRERISSGAVTLAFVDLLGTNVAMATLVRLTANLPIDLIVTYPEMDMVRNWQAALDEDPEHAPRFDRFFGTTGWRVSLKRLKAGRRHPDVLIEFYAEQLKALDYHTSVLPLTMKNRKGGTLYRPIFASRHTRGIDFWEKISSKREPSGQGRLL